MFNYKNLDVALGIYSDIIHRDKELGRLHDELKGRLKIAQYWFDRANQWTKGASFDTSPVCPSVKARFDAMMEILRVRYKIKLPNV